MRGTVRYCVMAAVACVAGHGSRLALLMIDVPAIFAKDVGHIT